MLNVESDETAAVIELPNDADEEPAWTWNWGNLQGGTHFTRFASR